MSNEGRQKTRLFLSYSRKDKEFTQKVHRALVSADMETWVDWEGIPLTADWWAEIENGIKSADGFVFVISPDSLKSEVCGKEVATAVNFQKRIIPILYRNPEKGDPMHEKISAHNWIYMRDEVEFEKAWPNMITAINTDLDYIKLHTRMTERAVEWEKHRRSNAYTLRGEDLSDAEAWLAHAGSKKPDPTDLQGEYIFASRKDTSRRQRMLLTGVSFALVVTVILAIAAFFQFQRAEVARGEAVASGATAIAESYARATQQAIAEENEKIAIAESFARATQQAIAEANEVIAIEEGHARATQQAIAEANEAIAIEQRNVAVAQQLAAQSQLMVAENGNLLTTSTLFAIESLKRYPSLEAETALRNDVQLLPIPVESKIYALNWPKLSQDGQYVVTFNDPNMMIFEAGTDNVVADWSLSESPFDFTISPHSEYMALNYSDRFEIRELMNGTIISVGLNDSPINKINFSDDGSQILTADANFRTRIWNKDSGGMISETTNFGYVRDFELSPNALFQAVAIDNVVYIINRADGSFVATLFATNPYNDIIFSPDSQRFATASSDNLVRVYETNGWTNIASFTHDGLALTVQFSQDGNFLLSTSSDLTARVWNLLTKEPQAILSHDTYAQGAAFGSNEEALEVVTLSEAQTFTRWEIAPGEIGSYPATGEVLSVDFSQDGSIVAYVAGRFVEIWDVKARQRLILIETETDDFLRGVALHPNGEWVAAGGGTGIVRLWDIQTGEVIREFIQNSEMDGIAFTADGSRIVTGCYCAETIVWDVATGERIHTITEPGPIWGIAISPDDKWIGTSGEVSTNLWNLETGEIVHELGEGGAGVAFSPDSLHIAATQRNIIVVWDIATGNVAREFDEGSNSLSFRTVFSSDERYIAGTFINGRVVIWDFETMEVVTTLSHPSKRRIYGLDFSPDSSWIATGSDDHTVQIWYLSVDDLIAEACNRLPGNLTEAVWAEKFPFEEYHPTCENLP